MVITRITIRSNKYELVLCSKAKIAVCTIEIISNHICNPHPSVGWHAVAKMESVLSNGACTMQDK